MERVLASLLVCLSAVLLLVGVPSEGSYPFGPAGGNLSTWNSGGIANPNKGWSPPIGGRSWSQRNSSASYWPGQRNSSVYWPGQRNSSAYWPGQRNASAPWPAGRYPRSASWGNTTSNSSHNYFWGYKGPYDRLLYFSRVKRERSWLSKVTATMDFPARSQRPNGTITAIQVLDQRPAGEGGYVTINRGGVGYRNVTLRFKSQRNKSFDFAVYIFGR